MIRAWPANGAHRLLSSPASDWQGLSFSLHRTTQQPWELGCVPLTHEQPRFSPHPTYDRCLTGSPRKERQTPLVFILEMLPPPPQAPSGGFLRPPLSHRFYLHPPGPLPSPDLFSLDIFAPFGFIYFSFPRFRITNAYSTHQRSLPYRTLAQQDLFPCLSFPLLVLHQQKKFYLLYFPHISLYGLVIPSPLIPPISPVSTTCSEARGGLLEAPYIPSAPFILIVVHGPRLAPLANRSRLTEPCFFLPFHPAHFGR